VNASKKAGSSKQDSQEGAVIAVPHRLDVEMQEPLELLDVAIGRGEEILRLGRPGRGRSDPRRLELGFVLITR